MKVLLEKLFLHEILTRREAHRLLCEVADKVYPEAQVASLLTVYRMREVSVPELLGFRDALLERAHQVDLSAYRPLDIVGTGGDGKNTFNISTCACFVVAAAGYPVAKHGNYAATSVSGASTVLEGCGVRFSADADRLQRSMEGCGMAYLHAPLFHPALAAVGPLRRQLGVKTVFNLLGPLVNPSRPAYQLLGVANLQQMRLYTQVLRHTGMGFTVATSLQGYDEISLTGQFKMMTNHSENLYTPAQLGLSAVPPEALSGGTTSDEARHIFLQVLQNEAPAARRDCVLANAAVGIHTVCPQQSIETCLEQAREALLSGRALQVFRQFVELNS
ncbi:MAG: anthranilate phosphoribosyltransferase [Alloprevotella sp.]